MGTPLSLGDPAAGVLLWGLGHFGEGPAPNPAVPGGDVGLGAAERAPSTPASHGDKPFPSAGPRPSFGAPRTGAAPLLQHGGHRHPPPPGRGVRRSGAGRGRGWKRAGNGGWGQRGKPGGGSWSPSGCCTFPGGCTHPSAGRRSRPGPGSRTGSPSCLCSASSWPGSGGSATGRTGSAAGQGVGDTPPGAAAAASPRPAAPGGCGKGPAEPGARHGSARLAGARRRRRRGWARPPPPLPSFPASSREPPARPRRRGETEARPGPGGG